MTRKALLPTTARTAAGKLPAPRASLAKSAKKEKGTSCILWPERAAASAPEGSGKITRQ